MSEYFVFYREAWLGWKFGLGGLGRVRKRDCYGIMLSWKLCGVWLERFFFWYFHEFVTLCVVVEQSHLFSIYMVGPSRLTQLGRVHKIGVMCNLALLIKGQLVLIVCFPFSYYLYNFFSYQKN